MKNKVSLIVIKNIIFLTIIILFQACAQNKDDQQKYVNGYLKIVSEMKDRSDVIKKGQEAIIAYRKSDFTDVDNAELAKDALTEGIKLDSISLTHLQQLDTPDEVSKEISMDLKRGIDAVSEGNRLFASNYAKAKNQTIEERKTTILNVKPGLISLAQGVNAVVVSMTKLDKYITDNKLEGREQLLSWFKQFKLERDNLRNFIK